MEDSISTTNSAPEARRRYISRLLTGLSIVFNLAGLVLSALIPPGKLGQRPALWPVDAINLSLVAYAIIGGLIIERKPRNRIGWIFLWIGFFWQIFTLTQAYIDFAILTSPGLPVPGPGLLLPALMWMAAFGISPLLLLLFPNGKLPSPRWRPVLWLLALANLTGLLSNGSLIEAWRVTYHFPSLLRLFGLGIAEEAAQSFMALEFLLVLFAGAAALITRLRRAKGVERQQMKWFCFAGVFFGLVTISESAFFDPLRSFSPAALVPADLFWGIPAALAFAAIPVAAAIAILRYRLYEIDSLIRRTLIFGVLSTILAVIYSGSVLMLEWLFQLLTGQGQSPIVIVLSTLAISALFEPLRRLVQQWIERRFYRRKYDAELVLARFSAAARNEVDLNRITGKLLDVVDETMQPEQVTLLLNKGR